MQRYKCYKYFYKFIKERYKFIEYFIVMTRLLARKIYPFCWFSWYTTIVLYALIIAFAVCRLAPLIFLSLHVKNDVGGINVDDKVTYN